METVCTQYAWLLNGRFVGQMVNPGTLRVAAFSILIAISCGRQPQDAFRMPIDDVFSIKGRGTVVTGAIESGTVHLGDTLTLERGDQSVEVTVAGIERFNTVGLKSASASDGDDEVGLLFRDVGHDQMERGNVLVGEPAR